MSVLRLFDPEHRSAAQRPHILPLRRVAMRVAMRSDLNIVARARVRFANRCCPGCRRATVAPLELNDSEFDRNGREIPGTATIIGFNCERCGHQWPANRPEAS